MHIQTFVLARDPFLDLPLQTLSPWCLLAFLSIFEDSIILVGHSFICNTQYLVSYFGSIDSYTCDKDIAVSESLYEGLS